MTWNHMLLIAMTAAALALGQPSRLLKRSPLDVFSFDYSAHRSPLAYRTYEGSVELMHKTKLIPRVKDIRGGFFLKKVNSFDLTSS